MNISKRSFATRLVCCLLVCLLLCCTVMRPVSASAVAAGATAGLAYVSVEAVIPWLLSALSVGYLASYGSDLYNSIKDALSEWAVTSSLGQSLKAYSYGSQYYLGADVLESAASVVNEYLAGDFSTICEKGLAFSNAYIIELNVGGGEIAKHCFWANTAPSYTQNGSTLTFTLAKPSILFTGLTNDYNDHSQSDTGTYTFRFFNSLLIGITTVSPSSLLQSDVLTEVNTLASSAISITDPSGEKKNAYPIISTQAADSSDVESTTTTVAVGAATASGSSTDLSGILGWLAKIYNAIVSLAASITAPITTAISEISTSIKEWWDAATTAITTAISDVRTAITSINGFLMNVLRARIEAIYSAISAFQTKVETLWDTATTTITTAISSAITDIIEWLKSLGATIADILEWLLSLPGILVDAIVEALTAVFVPSDAFIESKVEALRLKFDWIDPLLVYVGNFTGELTGPTPPVIYIHLGDAEGSLSYGGTVAFLDMRWYSRYKATGDAIISGFLWAIFIWRMFMRLPGIINGATGAAGNLIRISERDG